MGVAAKLIGLHRAKRTRRGAGVKEAAASGT
jgi:hypothetical protein